MERATTLQDMATRALTRPSTQEAIEFEGQWIAWGAVRRFADRLNALVEASGIAPATPIVFVPRNRPEAVAALLALTAQGRSVRLVYAFQSSAAIARDLTALDARLVIAARAEFAPEVVEALQSLGAAAIVIDATDAAHLPGFEVASRPEDASAPAEPEIQILTSGTTGPPKRFALSHATIAHHVVGANKNYTDAESDFSHLAPLLFFFPIGNISGIYSLFPTLLRGHRITLLERFTLAGWHAHLLRHRPERSGLPPAGIQMALDADVPVEDLACVRAIGTGAAPLDPGVHRAFEARYGVPILLSYGATEFAGPVAAMTPELHAEWGKAKFGSVGRAIGGSQLRVVDPESGAVLPPGEEGLLEVITPRIGPDWIRTADIAVIDADGFLFHRGRADGAIIRGGFKLLPETIERALLLHPAVSAAAVIGVEDRRLGQVPAAAVQLRSGAEATSVELEAHLRQHLLATHIPAHWRFVPELPRTPSVKVDRPAIKALFES